MKEALEMVRCPKCGKLFPKGRKMLGYNYCIDCTPQSMIRPVIEGQLDGEDVVTTVRLVSQQEYNAIQRSKNVAYGGLSVDPDIEEAPDLSTFEQQDEEIRQLSPADREAALQAAENEHQGMSENAMDELERMSYEKDF